MTQRSKERQNLSWGQLTYQRSQVLHYVFPLHLLQDGQQLPDGRVRVAGPPVLQHRLRRAFGRLVVLYLQVGEAHGLRHGHPVRSHHVPGVQIQSQLFPHAHVESDKRDGVQVHLGVRAARHVGKVFRRLPWNVRAPLKTCFASRQIWELWVASKLPDDGEQGSDVCSGLRHTHPPTGGEEVSCSPSDNTVRGKS